MLLTKVPEVAHLSRFFRVLTSRLRPSLASVASSSSRWSLRRDALARVASSSASSSCRLSCFILALAFSILGKSYKPSQTKLVKPNFVSLPPECVSTALHPVSHVSAHRCAHIYTCALLKHIRLGAGLRPFDWPANISKAIVYRTNCVKEIFCRKVYYLRMS